MRSSRLLTYAIFGIIGGLLFENKFLRVKQTVKDKQHALKEKQHELEKQTRHVKRNVSAVLTRR